MLRCPRCQSDNLDGSNFCKRCGSPLATAQPRPAAAATPRVTLAQPHRKRGNLKWVAVGVVALVVLVGIAAALSLGPGRNAPGGMGGKAGGSSQAILTTLAAVVDGNFTSAVDKMGDGGSYVEVRDVVVFKVITEELDGDWHVYMQDPTYDHIIGEIVPRDQGAEGKPPIGVPLVVWGITYCDVEHQDASWHGDTCWEIHPLTAWEQM